MKERSDRPEGVAAYSLQNAVGDAVGTLDGFVIDAADIVGHDWGAAVMWLHATAHPGSHSQARRVFRATPAYAAHAAQREMACYRLFLSTLGNKPGTPIPVAG